MRERAEAVDLGLKDEIRMIERLRNPRSRIRGVAHFGVGYQPVRCAAS